MKIIQAVSRRIIEIETYALAAVGVGSFLKECSSLVKWQNKLVGSLYCALGSCLALQYR